MHLASLFWTALLSHGREEGWQVSVELTDTTEMPSTAMEELKREVEEIYWAASVRIQWLPEGDAVHLPEHAGRVYILDRLPAMLETRLRAFRDKLPMAVSLGERGSRSAQAIYVSYSAVFEKTSRSTALSPEAMGRAFGRVVAHELAHRFVSRDHGRTGILREGFLSSELTGLKNDLRFTEAQLSALHQVAQPILEHASARK
jgi:hypothetical protein